MTYRPVAPVPTILLGTVYQQRLGRAFNSHLKDYSVFKAFAGLWEDGTTFLNPKTDGRYVRTYDSDGSAFSELRSDRLSIGGATSAAVAFVAVGTAVTVYKGDGSTPGATFHVPGTPTGSLQLGSGADAGDSDTLEKYNTVVGVNASVSGNTWGNQNVAVGYNATLTGDGTNPTRAVCIGANSVSTGRLNVVIGGGASASQALSVVIGGGAAATSSNVVVIGHGASAAQKGVAVGDSASAGATETVAIGYNAVVVTGTGLAIGASANAASTSSHSVGNSSQANIRGTCLGYQAYADTDGVALGYLATTQSDAQAVAIGRSAQTYSHYSVAIGYIARAYQKGTSIGWQAQSTVNHSDCYGAGATTGTARRAVFNSQTEYRDDYFFGAGDEVTAPTWGGGNGVGLNAPVSSGTNVAGCNLRLVAGFSTGSARGGAIQLRSSPATGSGSGVNGAVNVIEIDGGASLGRIGLYGATPVARAAALTAKDTGTVNSGDATTDNVIDNNRTRIDEIETVLANLGATA